MGFEQIKDLNENQVLRSVKLELYPTEEQAQLIQKYILKYKVVVTSGWCATTFLNAEKTPQINLWSSMQ